jgi:hypothetical protein
VYLVLDNIQTVGTFYTVTDTNMKGSFRPVLKVHIAFWTLAGTAWGAGPQNPFGRASNEELNAGGSFGSQNPFGSNGAADPSQGIQSNFPEHQTHGCPAIRAQAPTPDSVQTYATSRACPLGKNTSIGFPVYLAFDKVIGIYLTIFS